MNKNTPVRPDSDSLSFDFDVPARMAPPSVRVMIGKKFGNLTVIQHCEPNRKDVLCQCDCGNVAVKDAFKVRSGHVSSCGCKASVRLVHGQYQHSIPSPSLSTWKAIQTRCNNPNYAGHKNHGARGIKVCAAWRARGGIGFSAFLRDMGERPSREHSIDRIDNDGHYSCGHCEECITNGWPANCRWATRIQQGSNKRNNRLLNVRGVTYTFAEASRVFGVCRATIITRVESGWNHEDAVRPARPWNKRTQ